MSIAVSIDDLPAAISAQIGWCYLLTVSEQGQARVLAIAPQWDSRRASLRAEVGRGTAANVSAHPEVSMVWPPAAPDGYSLIADGAATVDGLVVTFRPVTAVLHRPATTGGAS